MQMESSDNISKIDELNRKCKQYQDESELMRMQVGCILILHCVTTLKQTRKAACFKSLPLVFTKITGVI